ncbi:DUF4172 domain-containing protein, partial [Tenacibaculum finnmarkense]|nr:DUF4172 domain-containing protein [Tenacibaculum finnmarkense genomovar finnmarkense]MCG8713745.1 DUF4172 domain-containing protein [Tenacibaculum finnmarkense]MCG8729553.1 DUF4172 domain-containing protein [Tenacibaculum finnmarkense]MCG8739994.1 DUF4172 domain-containing protein [Tenacibaculum finnmarkense]MCG8745287.1 DUF4172 domain-containing protein [Tenacibaculum finnmarkense]
MHRKNRQNKRYNQRIVKNISYSNYTIKTSEIEGEFLSRTDVMSSVRNNLNINTSHENVKDIKAKGIG